MAVKGISIKLEGVKEITDILNQLPEKVRDDVLRSFNRKALTENIVRPLRSVLPYSSQTKSKIKVLANSLNKTAVVAGPSSDVFYVRFVEKGTVERRTKKGARRGKITPRNKLEPFVDGQVNNIIKYVNNQYGEEINNFVKRKALRLKR